MPRKNRLQQLFGKLISYRLGGNEAIRNFGLLSIENTSRSPSTKTLY